MYYNPLQEQFKMALNKVGYNAKANNNKDIKIILKPYKERVNGIEYTYLLAEVGGLKQGDIVEINGTKYFVNHEETTANSVYSTFVVRRIKHTVKFIIEDNKLHIFNGAIDEGVQSISGDKVLTTLEGRIIVLLQENEDTLKLSIGKKFIKFNDAWRIISITNAEKGILKLYCEKDTTSHLDDKVNEIADRWVQVGSEKIDRLPWLDNQQPPEEPEIPQEPTVARYEITPILQYQDDTPYEIWHNSWQKYTIKKFVDDVEVNGNFTFELSSTKATLSEATNNSCKVSVASIVGKYVANLIVTDADTNEIAIEKSINIMGR